MDEEIKNDELLVDPKDLDAHVNLDDAFEDDLADEGFEDIDAYQEHEDDEDHSFTDRDGDY